MTARTLLMEHYGATTEAAALDALKADGRPLTVIAPEIGIKKVRTLHSAVGGMRRRVAAGEGFNLRLPRPPHKERPIQFKPAVDIDAERRSEQEAAAIETPLEVYPTNRFEPGSKPKYGHRWYNVGPRGNNGAGRPRGTDVVPRSSMQYPARQSDHEGIRWDRDAGRWRAYVRKAGGGWRYVGQHPNEEGARKVQKEAVKAQAKNETRTAANESEHVQAEKGDRT